jgi:uncharacterized protein YcaQ
MQGDLMIAGRDGFQKVYDLTERVLPADIDTTPPTTAEYAAHLLDVALDAHGFVAQKEVTYGRRGTAIRKALRAHLDALVGDGALVEFTENDVEYVARPELLDRAAPRHLGRVRMLSPFDNAVIQRDRNVALHEFDYQIECYVPAPKRRFGYFCLPILYGDRLVGRVDCKAHRRDRRLDLLHLHVESDVRDRAAFAAAFGAAVRDFAAFNECDTARLLRVSPSDWRADIRNAVEGGV